MITSDLQLLREYARSREEDLFSAMVRRHVNLVYSTALRHVRSPQLAEEVTQSTFVDLATNAVFLAQKETNLTGWLYTVAYRRALNVVRGETRRKFREKVAVETYALNVEIDDWRLIEPSLEEAMHSLGEFDKAAILLRFFENKSLRDVGHELKITEAAAQKRLNRAVDRLRDFFRRHGKKQLTDGWIASISSNAIQAGTSNLEHGCLTAMRMGHVVLSNGDGVIAAKQILMNTIQKAYVGSFVVIAIAAGLFEIFELGPLAGVNELLAEQLSHQVTALKQLTQEASDLTSRAAMMESQKEQLDRNTSEILALRSEEEALKKRLAQISEFSMRETSDPLLIAATGWLNRFEHLQRYYRDKFPESQHESAVLSKEDWLQAVSQNQLDSDAAYNKALGKLKIIAGRRFAKAVGDGVRAFSEANSNLLPAEVLQLAGYVKAPYGSFLREFEIVQIPGNRENSSGLSADPALKKQVDWGLTGKPSTTGSLFLPNTQTGHVTVIRAGGFIEDLLLVPTAL